MEYSSTPYVGMVQGKNGSCIKAVQNHAFNCLLCLSYTVPVILRYFYRVIPYSMIGRRHPNQQVADQPFVPILSCCFLSSAKLVQ